jgi:hypothetical protein
MKSFAPIILAGCCAFGAAGCSRSPSAEPAPAEPPAPFPRPAAGEFAVMTFNLNQYALLDRDGDADTLEPKPPEEAGSIVEVIRQVSPDVLAVQEMGDPAAWAEFKYSLRQAGLDYGHEEYLRRGKSLLTWPSFPASPSSPRIRTSTTSTPSVPRSFRSCAASSRSIWKSIPSTACA